MMKIVTAPLSSPLSQHYDTIQEGTVGSDNSSEHSLVLLTEITHKPPEVI